MKIRILIQATILLIIISIFLSFFYYQYLGDTKEILSKKNKTDEIKTDELSEDIVNELVMLNTIQLIKMEILFT